MNSQYFSFEDVKAGLHFEFIQNLLNYNQKTKSSYFNDIHITTDDGSCVIVEWVHDDLSEPLYGSFQFIPIEKSDEVYGILHSEVENGN